MDEAFAGGLPAFPEALLARYIPLKVLGTGGMGTVYLARARELDRLVAVKVARGAAVDPPTRVRFGREAQALTRLKSPGLPVIYESGESPATGEPWLVMEYLDGPDLAKCGPAMDREARLEAMLKVADALAEVHRAGLAHRDVKPGNVIVARDGRVVLTDFGLVWDPGRTRLTEQGHVVGTFGFLAPELLDGRLPGPASDWYAWGATLYNLLEGRPPFTMDELAQTYKGRPLPGLRFATLAPDSPETRLLRAMLAADPGARPKDPAEIRFWLGRSGGVPPPVPASPSASGAVPRVSADSVPQTAVLPRPTGRPAPPAGWPGARRAAALAAVLALAAGLARLGRRVPGEAGGPEGFPGVAQDPSASPAPAIAPEPGDLAEAVDGLAARVERLSELAAEVAARTRDRDPVAARSPVEAFARRMGEAPPAGGREELAFVAQWLDRERARAGRLLAGSPADPLARRLVRVLEELLPLADLVEEGSPPPAPPVDPRALLGAALPTGFEERSRTRAELAARTGPGVDLAGPWLLAPVGLPPATRAERDGLLRMADMMDRGGGDPYARELDGWVIHPAMQGLVSIPAGPGPWVLVLHQLDAWVAWKLVLRFDLEVRSIYLPRRIVQTGVLRMGGDLSGAPPDYRRMATARIPLPAAWTTAGPHELRLEVAEPGEDRVGRVQSDLGPTVRIGWISLEPGRADGAAGG